MDLSGINEKKSNYPIKAVSNQKEINWITTATRTVAVISLLFFASMAQFFDANKQAKMLKGLAFCILNNDKYETIRLPFFNGFLLSPLEQITEVLLPDSQLGLQSFLNALNQNPEIPALQQNYQRALKELETNPNAYAQAETAFTQLQNSLNAPFLIGSFLKQHAAELARLNVSTELWHIDDLREALVQNYACLPLIPQFPVQNNLLQNPNFNEGVTGWQTAGAASVVGQSDPFDIQNQILMLGGDGNAASATQTLALPESETGAYYFITAYVKNTDPSIPATVAINGAVQNVKAASWSDTTEWYPIQFRVFSTGGEVPVTLSVYNGGTAYFTGLQFTQEDDIKRVPANPSRTAYDQPLPVESQPREWDNLFRNPNFDSFPNAIGQPNYPWALDPLASIVDGGTLRGLLLDTSQGMSGGDVHASQYVPYGLPPGTDFQITGEVWVEGSADATIEVDYVAHQRGQQDQHLSFPTQGNIPNSWTGQWQPFTSTFTTPLDQCIEPTLKFTSSKYETGKITFRNLSLTPTDSSNYSAIWSPTPDGRGPKCPTTQIDDFQNGDVLNDHWLIYNKAWSIADEIPSNVTYNSNGVQLTSTNAMDPSSGKVTRTQGCIVSQEYFGSADVNVTLTFPEGGLPSGYTCAIWNFSWQELSPSTAEGNTEPSPERNREGDLEIGSDDKYPTTPPSHMARLNAYGGQLGGEPDISNRVDIYQAAMNAGINIYDGKPHTFTMRTVSGSPGAAGYMAWYIDGLFISQIPGEPYGQDYIPRAPMRVCIGLENPAWAGPLDASSSASVTINQIEIAPFEPNDTEYPTANDQPYAMETDPNGTSKGACIFAPPHEYPAPLPKKAGQHPSYRKPRHPRPFRPSGQYAEWLHHRKDLPVQPESAHLSGEYNDWLNHLHDRKSDSQQPGPFQPSGQYDDWLFQKKADSDFVDIL